MSLFDRLFKRAIPSLSKENSNPKVSGELIAELTGGASLVDGKNTWDHADANKKNWGQTPIFACNCMAKNKNRFWKTKAPNLV